MPGRRALAALLSTVAMTVVLPLSPAHATPVAALRAAPTCDRALTTAPPTTTAPWAHNRYAPDRLAPFATGAGVTVAVVDSGVDSRHIQLKGRVLSGRDFLQGKQSADFDCQGHGTGVASIIAARPAKGIIFRGLAPDAKILPVRVSEQRIIEGEEAGKTVTAATFASAIRWAVEAGAKVMNLSVVLYRDEPAVREAIAYAIHKDVVVVAAAGNRAEEGNLTPYPAAYDGVIGVGAIGPDGIRSVFSQLGPYVDVVAPGSGVVVAAPGTTGHREEGGTSYAAPFVSATAALLRQYRPELSAKEIAARIMATADPAPGGKPGAYGAGVLNPYRAVTEPEAGERRAPSAVSPVTLDDPASAALASRRSVAQQDALRLTAIAGGMAAIALLLAVVLPRGAHRRWRPAGPASTGGATSNSDDR